MCLIENKHTLHHILIGLYLSERSFVASPCLLLRCAGGGFSGVNGMNPFCRVPERLLEIRALLSIEKEIV
jgi:hypothetical protein